MAASLIWKCATAAVRQQARPAVGQLLPGPSRTATHHARRHVCLPDSNRTDRRRIPGGERGVSRIVHGSDVRNPVFPDRVPTSRRVPRRALLAATWYPLDGAPRPGRRDNGWVGQLEGRLGDFQSSPSPGLATAEARRKRRSRGWGRVIPTDKYVGNENPGSSHGRRGVNRSNGTSTAGFGFERRARKRPGITRRGSGEPPGIAGALQRESCDGIAKHRSPYSCGSYLVFLSTYNDVRAVSRRPAEWQPSCGSRGGASLGRVWCGGWPVAGGRMT